MDARRALPVTAGLAMALTLTLVGCTLTQTALRKDADQDGEAAVLGQGARWLAPKRCRLDVVILTRPQGDSLINDVLWGVADEQLVEPERRRALQANGLRVGLIAGSLPPKVEELLKVRPPHNPDVQSLINPDDTPARIDASHAPARPELTLLLSHLDAEGKPFIKGKSYKDAKAFLRVNATHAEGPDGVDLKITPEVHHGPVTPGFGALPNIGGVPVPLEFQMTNGQKEESFRDLATTIDLKPGQIAVLGCYPDRAGSLGDLIYEKPEGQSDRVLQSVVLVWATRSATDATSPGASGSAAAELAAPGVPASPEPPAALLPVDPSEFEGEPASPSTGPTR